MNIRWKIAQFFEIRWWRRYLGDKDKQAYLAWKKDYWQRFLENSGIVLPAHAQILDAGCGPAGIFIILDKYKVDAVDPLLEQYESEGLHFLRNDYPGVRFYNQPLEQFVPDHLYEAVFCLNAINHVADLAGCFDKLVSMTVQGGQLAVSIDAHNYHWLKRIFRLFPGDVLHPHQYDLQEYQDMLTQRGCTVDKTVLVKSESIFNYFLLVATRL